MEVTMEFHLLVDGQIVRNRGQRPESRLPRGLEYIDGALVSGAVIAVGDHAAPGEKIPVALCDGGGLPAGAEVALHEVDATLDFAFVLGRSRPAGRDEEAVVLSELRV